MVGILVTPVLFVLLTKASETGMKIFRAMLRQKEA